VQKVFDGQTAVSVARELGIGENLIYKVISALIKAISKGLVKAGAIIHSDRGSQYASNGFRELLRIEGFRQSMSGRGNCYDNAHRD
jgi:transposase InsO family protein